MESPYQKYLDTNYVPTVAEARHIQTIVDESAKEMGDLSAQIDKLREKLGVLQEKRSTIQTFSDKHQALLSPMRQLTRDILEEIFIACLPMDRNSCMSATEAPMLLTRICSSWRQIASSTPRIWAKIHIPLPIVKIGQYASEKELIAQEEQVRSTLKLRETAVSEWLNRSHACPLSISIYQTPGWAHPELTEKHYIVCEELRNLHVSFMHNTIVPHHKRWRDFDIYAADDTLCGFLDIGLKAENLEILKSLHVTHQMTFTPGLYPILPYKWKDIVSLMPFSTTAATFNSFPIRNSDIPFINRLAWGNLMQLSLRLDEDSSSTPVNAVQSVASILRHCHSLRTLKLMIWSSRDESLALQQTEDIVLPYLTTLSISIPLSPDGLAFARLLYLPSINDFGFQCASTAVDDILTSVLEMVTSILRASEDYNAIRMYTPYWASSFDDLVDMLKRIPAIRCLMISSQPMDFDRWTSPTYFQSPQTYFRKVVNDNLLQALIPTNRSYSDIICPNLEVLTSENKLITGITETCLKEFLVARENDERVPSLRRISVYIDEPKQKQDSTANKISLGTDSAVYFKSEQTSPYSPFDGFTDDLANVPPLGTLASDCYHEL